jgi:hypothetical protein
MEIEEQREFTLALAEAEELIQRTQAALQRARARCHADVYEHLDLIAKRTYEIKVRSAWLRLVVLRAIEPVAEPQARENVDRRAAIDRRVEGMRRQVLAVTRLQAIGEAAVSSGLRE